VATGMDRRNSTRSVSLKMRGVFIGHRGNEQKQAKETGDRVAQLHRAPEVAVSRTGSSVFMCVRTAFRAN
jgi:hypothetical protein